jgi:SOS-response transcriptional repressor LexA
MVRSKIEPVKLFELTGIAVTTINNLKRGQGNPTLSTLQSLAEFFDISIGDLTERDLSAHNLKKTSSSLVLIDLNTADDYLTGTSQKNLQSISVELEPSLKEKSFAIKITNSSMAPFFEKGTVFILSKNTIAHDGDLVLVKFGNNPVCFRRVLIEEDSYFFSPISELLGKDPYKSKNFTIYGVVIKAIQYFHE